MPYTTAAAAAAALTIATSYVAAIYILPVQQHRSSPAAVRRRLVAATAITAFWLAAVPVFLVAADGAKDLPHAVALLGLIPGLTHTHDGARFAAASALQYLWDLGRTTALVGVLFAGPLADVLLSEGGRGLVRDLVAQLRTLQGLRVFVVGPATEELVYRCCLLATLVPLRRVGVDGLVLASPLCFGVAHLHHAWELRREDGLPAAQIAAVCAFQMLYTTLFGAFAAFVLLRTGNAASVCFVHSFCNYFGVPAARPSSSTAAAAAVYYGLLVAGAAAFWVLLFPLTESINSPIAWHSRIE